MSATIWNEEVYTGLKNEVMKYVKKRTSTGVVNLNDKEVLIRKPEEEFKPESYPCVSLYITNQDHNKVRYNKDPKMVSLDKENSVAVMQDSPVPFDMTVNIDFWSKSQTDMDLMTKDWLSRHFRQFNLPVMDSGGNERTCNCLRKGGIVKADLVKNAQRLYHSIISYTIWVEIDEEVRYNANVATKINIEVSQK